MQMARIIFADLGRVIKSKDPCCHMPNLCMLKDCPSFLPRLKHRAFPKKLTRIPPFFLVLTLKSNLTL